MFEYIVLTHDLLTFGCHLIVVLLSLKMFYQKILNIKINPTLLIFFYYLIVFNLSGVLYRGYLLAYWRPTESIYNQQVMFWIGVAQWVLRRTSTLFETALCIERSIAIAFPFRYSKTWRLSICGSTLVLFIGLTIATVFWNNLTEVPKSMLTSCMFFCCVVKCGSEIYLVIASLIEFVSAMILLLIIKFNPQQYNIAKNKTKAILIIVFTSLVCDLSPNVIDEIYFWLRGESLINILGTYHATLSAIGVLLGVYSYYFVLTKQKARAIGNVVTVS